MILLPPVAAISELGYVTEKDFQSDVLDAAQPVLVDFTTSGLGEM